jgi:hypothetical protein
MFPLNPLSYDLNRHDREETRKRADREREASETLRRNREEEQEERRNRK